MVLSKKAVVFGLLGLGVVAAAWAISKASTRGRTGSAYFYGGVPTTMAVPAEPSNRYTQPSLGYYENPTQ
jgi:hypothetical protein